MVKVLQNVMQRSTGLTRWLRGQLKQLFLLLECTDWSPIVHSSLLLARNPGHFSDRACHGIPTSHVGGLHAVPSLWVQPSAAPAEGDRQ